MRPEEDTGTQAGPYQLFMLALCFLALASLAVVTLVQLSAQTLSIFAYFDLGVCTLFFADFLYSFASAKDRKEYFLRWGWIDLISSIPMVDALRIGRAARIMRIIRVLRGVRATKILATFLLDRRAEGAFLAAALLSILLVAFSSVAVLQFEQAADGANIKTAEDAAWWAFVTITTVGYGDRFPVSTEGRMVAAMLMTAGVGLFGTFSGFVAAWFLKPSGEHRDSEIAHIREELGELKRLLIQRAQTDSSREGLDNE